MSDLDIASLHLFPNCLVVVLTKACSETRNWLSSWMLLALFLVVAPSSHLSHLSIRSSFLHTSGLIFEPGSELQFGRHQSNRTPRMFLASFLASFSNLAHASCMFLSLFLVSLLNLAPSSRLRHVSIGLSFVEVLGLVAGRGPELATPVDQINF